MAEQWFESKRKLRPWTRKYYRDALDRILLPRFGNRKIASITPDDVAKLIRELEAKGLAAKTIENYLLPVFASNEGTPLEHRNVTRRGFEPAVARAGIENFTFHDMRHAFASRMIARGIEPVTLAKLMGHEDIRETLNTYSHPLGRVRIDDVV